MNLARDLSRPRGVFCAVRVLSTVAVLLFVTVRVSAEPGLDVAIIVDQSKSMARHARIAPALLRLSIDLLARNAAAHRVEHRMAVISFGSSAHVDVPFTTVGVVERTRIVDSVRSGHRGETNVLAAFTAARRLFGTLPPDASRRRAIVLMTDGVPYVRGTDMSQYMAALRRYVASDLPTTEVSIDILLLSERRPSRQDAAWRSLTQDVHHAGLSAANVLATAHTVMTRLAGTVSAESAPSKTTPGVDTLIVPPYLEMIVFDIFRASANAAVDVFPPGSGTPIREGVEGVEAVRMGDVLATLAVSRPRPGQWLVRKSRSGAEVRVRSQQFFPRGVLLQPSTASTTLVSDRVRIAYRVLDGTERPIEELHAYPLSLHVMVASPDGRKRGFPMERDGDKRSATFRTTEDAHCTIAGRYWTDVRVTTTDAADRPLDVFRDRWSGFTVMPSQTPVQSNALTAPPRSAIARLHPLIWFVLAITVVLFLIGALLRRRKPKGAASCLSRHSEQDER